MRVGVLVREAHVPERGGSFTFQSSIIEALSDLSCSHEFIVFHKGPELNRYADQISFVSLRPYKRNYGWHRYAPRAIIRWWQKACKLVRYLLSPLPWKPASILEKAARDKEVELMWFPTPGFVRTGLPYIATVWDLAHRVVPIFPELRRTGETWEAREEHYQNVLGKAAFVITGTETGKEQIHKYYRIDRDRIKVNPFPTPSFAMKDQAERQVVEEDNKRPFILYPARFWPHKNHVVVLEALRLLRDTGLEISAVFTGSDMGNGEYVKGVAGEKGVEDLVDIRGFVSRETLYYLYQNALALVYVSYLGPDNLPPLEAFGLGCPVIASDIEGARDQLGEAALFVDPTSALDLARAIREIHTSSEKRTRLVQKGQERALRWQPSDYVERIVSILDSCAPYRCCWDRLDTYEHP